MRFHITERSTPGLQSVAGKNQIRLESHNPANSHLVQQNGVAPHLYFQRSDKSFLVPGQGHMLEMVHPLEAISLLHAKRYPVQGLYCRRI